MFYFHLFNRFFMTVCLFIGRFYCVLVNINVEISSIVSHCYNIYFCRIEDSFDCAEQQNLVCRFNRIQFCVFFNIFINKLPNLPLKIQIQRNPPYESQLFQKYCKFRIIKPKAHKNPFFIHNKIPISMQHEAIEKCIPRIVATHSDRPKNKSFM